MKGLQTQGPAWVAIIAIVGGVLNLLFDGNPETQPNWNEVIPALALAVGLIRARAKNQTSEEAIKGKQS